MFVPSSALPKRPQVSKTQSKWTGGYVSELADSRIPDNSFANMTNMELDQDGLPRPRESLVQYGEEFIGTDCIGIGTYTKIESNEPVRYEISMQVTPTNEVQTLSITGTPTSGHFTLTYAGQTTGNIAYNAAPSDVQTALIALSNIGASDVFCGGASLPAGSITITFQATLANTDVALITSTDTFSGGSTPASHIVQTMRGGNRGAIYTRKDGGTWSLIAGNYWYDTTAWVQFCQSSRRVYISNKVDTMSFFDIDGGSITSYTALSTPSAPGVTPTGLTGSTFPVRYRITAQNAVGETVASTAGTATVLIDRDNWDSATEYVDLTWSAVTGATRYNIYYGDTAGFENYIDSVPTGTLAYHDLGGKDGKPINPVRLAPKGDSTKGPIINYMINKNGQLFAVGDKDNPYYLWYSGVGAAAGDFSPFNGGGFVAIDDGSDNLPISVHSFQGGRLMVLGRNAAGKSKMYSVTFTTQTVGNTVLTFPQVDEITGQSGSYGSRAVVEANNGLYYPSGREFKTTISQPLVPGSFSTNSISFLIKPDVDKLDLSAMEKSVGIEYQNRIFWALPVGNSENNEIWVLDLSRGGCWILRWTIAAKHLWLYEDNNGSTHFCTLVNGKTLEFTRGINTTDDSTAFQTHLVSNSMLFDNTGVSMAYILDQHFKFLYPKGTILLNIYGLTEDSVDNGGNELLDSVGETVFNSFVPPTAWGEYDWSNQTDIPEWSGDPGLLVVHTKPVTPIAVDVDEIVNELRYEIITTQSNCDYLLSSVYTRGEIIEGSLLGD